MVEAYIARRGGGTKLFAAIGVALKSNAGSTASSVEISKIVGA